MSYPRFTQFLDFPAEIQGLALIIDSETPISWFLVILSLIHIVIFCVYFIKKVHASRIYKTLLLLAVLDVPIMIFAALYIAGLPKG